MIIYYVKKCKLFLKMITMNMFEIEMMTKKNMWEIKWIYQNYLYVAQIIQTQNIFRNCRRMLRTRYSFGNVCKTSAKSWARLKARGKNNTRMDKKDSLDNLLNWPKPSQRLDTLSQKIRIRSSGDYDEM